MSSNLTNWTKTKERTVTTRDKLKELMKIRHSLVLVQYHELERIRLSNRAENHENYINGLYKHYIIEGKPKTYLNN